MRPVPSRDGELLFIDASLFLSMHAIDERLRRSCKSFFVSTLGAPLAMGYEEVGRCDDVVWSKSRSLQDSYYPFMDRVHSELPICRRPLSEMIVKVAIGDGRLVGLPDQARFAVAMAMASSASLVTANPRLLATAALPVIGPPQACEEPYFPDHLEELYQRSLALRVDLDELVG